MESLETGALAERLTRTDLAVVILTYNETLHIARAIESIRSIAREIIVVDSFSTDDTVDLARALGATVLQNKFVNQSRQFSWALDNAQITAGWVMRLDADEVIEADLAEEIAEKLPGLPSDVGGVTLDRRHVFLGRWIKHGGRYPLRLLRIWRRGQARIEDRWMDEHMVLLSGRAVPFKGGFADINLQDIGFFTAKHNSYATREAIDVLVRKYELLPRDEDMAPAAASFQAAMKRRLKEHFYNKLPFWLSSSSYFLYRWIIQLGFLDGTPGLIYHVLQGYWYRFLVGAKVYEFERGIRNAETREAKLAVLSELSGYDVDAATSARRDIP